jgi:hypothetical protein
LMRSVLPEGAALAFAVVDVVTVLVLRCRRVRA